jgi:hypothetical protein
LFEPLAEPGALRQALEQGLRHRVLRAHPLARGLRIGVFEPAVGIGHGTAVIVVDHGAAGRLRVLEFLRDGGMFRPGRCRACDQQSDERAGDGGAQVARIDEHP